MKHKQRLMALVIALIITLIIVASMGCSTPGDTFPSSHVTSEPSPSWTAKPSPTTTIESLSAQHVDDFIAQCIAASAAVQTTEFNLQVSIETELTGGVYANKAVISGGGGGISDAAIHQMNSILNLTENNERADYSRFIFRNTYVVPEWVYYENIRIRCDTMEYEHDPSWAKTPITDDIWAEEDQFEQQMEFLRTAIEIAYSGTEYVDGVPCHVFEIVPDTPAILNPLHRFRGWMNMPLIVDFKQLSNPASIIKESSVKMWVDIDSRLPVKSTVRVVVEIKPGDFAGFGSDAFDLATMTMDITVNLRNYDRSVSLEPLPWVSEWASLIHIPEPTPTPITHPPGSVWLTKIEISPSSPSIRVGETLQFTATGTYSDGSTADITSQVFWDAMGTRVTISSTGLATGVRGGGTIKIYAIMDTVSTRIDLLVE